MMYSPDGRGGWHCLDSIWYYTYGSESGRRSKKLIKYPDASSAREIRYDHAGHGEPIEEIIVTDDGGRDESFGYARKTFERTMDGDLVRTLLFDYDGNLVSES
jgi:hypothetical protein